MIAQYKNELDQYIFAVFINRNLQHNVVNNNPREFSDVKVYAGDPWDLSANAVIRNFVYDNLE